MKLTEALISHAADTVCEHQSSAVVPPDAACREHSGQPGTSVSLESSSDSGVHDRPALGKLLNTVDNRGGSVNRKPTQSVIFPVSRSHSCVCLCFTIQ